MKKALIFLFIVIMTLSLVACGAPATANSPSASADSQQPSAASASQAPSASPSASAPAKQDVTITFMASNDWVQDAELALAKKFTEETGIKVDYQIVPSDQYPNLLQTKLNSGECTDIFCSQAGRFDIVSTLNVEKKAVDLSGEAWTGTLDKTAVTDVSVNGKIYGQPMQDTSAVWAIAYNKKIFAKLSLSVPKTWAEFMATCEAIKKSGVTPVYEPVSDGWHHVLWFAEMGCAYEKTEPGLVDKLNGNQTKFADSAVMKTAIGQIKDMIDKGYWGKNYMADAYADQAKNIASGKFAMSVANEGLPQQVADLKKDLKADDIGLFVMPLVDNQLLNVNPVSPTRFVYSGSKNIDVAKQYLAFLAKPENLQYMIDNVSKFQTLPFSGVKPKYAGTVKEFYDTYTNNGIVLQTAVKYVNPQWMEMGKEIVSVIQGKEDAAKMLVNIDKNRADQAAAAKDSAWK